MSPANPWHEKTLVKQAEDRKKYEERFLQIPELISFAKEKNFLNPLFDSENDIACRIIRSMKHFLFDLFFPP